MNVRCPLCRSKNIYNIEKIVASDLAGLYKKCFGISLLKEFATYEYINFCHCKECDLKFFNPPITGPEEFYEELQRRGEYYRKEKAEYDFACQFITEDASVLEIGCGKAAFTKCIRSCNYTGLEFNRKAQQMAKENGFRVLNESITEHAQNNLQRYAVVCSFQVQEHVPDVRNFLSSSIACLKPGGLLIVSVPAADSFLSLNTNLILNMPPHHVTWWSDKSLESISNIFGLEMIRLKHDKLADRHVSWYLSTVLLNRLNVVLGRSPRLIDTSLFGRVANGFGWVLGHLLAPIYILGRADKNTHPYGHSVTAIYRKRESC